MTSTEENPRLKSGKRADVRKRIALIAHDNRKDDLLAWAPFNRGTLSKHDLYGTGTTGGLIAEELGLKVHLYLSGPLGGDQQVGAAIAEGRIDAVIFFWVPLEPQPHDVDVKALLRIAVVYNVPIACNRATADFILSSPRMHTDYERAGAGWGGRVGAPPPASPPTPSACPPPPSPSPQAPRAGSVNRRGTA